MRYNRLLVCLSKRDGCTKESVDVHYWHVLDIMMIEVYDDIQLAIVQNNVSF